MPMRRRKGEYDILFSMKAPNQADINFVSIVAVDDATTAMLAYAESPEGRAKIMKARRELADGEGIVITPEYFENMNRRVSKRATATRSIEA